MNEQVKLIKEIINDLYLNNSELDSRLLDYNYNHLYLHGNPDIEVEDEKVLDAIEIVEFISSKNNKTMIKLNSLLDKKDKDIRVIELEQKMLEVQAKKIITVKEFTKIYGYSSDWQKNRRSRIRDRLPYIQTVDGGKITYNVKDVELWFENNNIQF